MTQEMTQYDKMTKTPLVKLIVSLGIPTTLCMLITSLYNMADTYFVGTLVSKALADRNKEEASEYVSTGFYTGLFFFRE